MATQIKANTLGTVLRAARRQSGLTIKEVAASVTYSKSHIIHIEIGDRYPTDALLTKLACTLHLSQDYVFYLAGRIPPDIRDTGACSDEVREMFNSFRATLRERGSK